MSDTLEEASKLFRRIEPAPTVTEYQREQQAIRDNYQRLKAERLARETARMTAYRVNERDPRELFLGAHIL